MRTRKTDAAACMAMCVILLSAAVARGAEPPRPPDYEKLYQQSVRSVVMVTTVETFGAGVTARTGRLANPFPPMVDAENPFCWLFYPLHMALDTTGDALDFTLYPLAALLAGAMKGTGSGIIIDDEGHVITNHHVVDMGDVYWAELHDRRLVRAKLIGSDEDEDYALLKLELKKGEKVVPAKLGDSSRLRVGQPVFAIGSPVGLRHTLSTGLVSGLERRLFGEFQEYIQTDLTVGCGSSGGPLFNLAGEVVGINTLIITRMEITSGITLSIPINNIQEGLGRLKEKGEVVRGFLGVHVKDVTPRVTEKLKLTARSGACIYRVNKFRGFFRTPAGKAGLQEGDVVIAYKTPKQELRIDRARTLARAVLNTAPGTDVTLAYVRGKATRQCTLKIGER